MLLITCLLAVGLGMFSIVRRWQGRMGGVRRPDDPVRLGKSSWHSQKHPEQASGRCAPGGRDNCGWGCCNPQSLLAGMDKS